MTDLFYITTFLFLFYELKWIYNPVEETVSGRKFYLLSKQFKGKKWVDYSDEYKELIKSRVPLLIVMVWFFTGLFTSQWITFNLFWAFQLIIIAPLSRITRFNMIYTMLHWLNSILGLIFGVFIFMNHYHWHINTYPIFKSFFGY